MIFSVYFSVLDCFEEIINLIGQFYAMGRNFLDEFSGGNRLKLVHFVEVYA